MQQQESYIAKTYGEEYVAEGTKTKSADKKIQDAHEAIRPTDITRTPAAIKDSLSRDQFRLYQLIWKRFTASRMQPANMRQQLLRSEQVSTVLLYQQQGLHLMDFALCM